MLTFYHSPNSRSTSVMVLLHELGVTDQVKTVVVTIPRQDGSGARDIQTQNGPVLALGEVSIRNFGLEGLGWDHQRQQLLAVTEKWPLRVLALDGPVLTPGARNLQLAVHTWESQDAAGVPSTDLASIEVDPRSGNLLLLGEESSVLYEYTRAGELLGMMPLWAGLSGLDESIGQPEGVAIDAAGTLYIVAEPNLFYRFERVAAGHTPPQDLGN